MITKKTNTSMTYESIILWTKIKKHIRRAPFPSRACHFPPLVSPPRTPIPLGMPETAKFTSQNTTSIESEQ